MTVADLAPATVIRPNGKTYRARRVTVQPWANETVHGDEYGVCVIGTHDVEGSRPLADAMIKSEWDGDMVATQPYQCWVRSGYRNGELCWITDETRGRAAVSWIADYPTLCTGCGNPMDTGTHSMGEYGGCVWRPIMTTEKENRP